MPMGNMVLETLIKWLIPFMCAGLVSIIVSLVTRPKEDRIEGAKMRALQKWEENARKSNVHKEICGKYFDEIKKQSDAMDQQILDKINSLATQLKDFQQESILAREKAAQQLDVVREGVLDAHLTNLIYTCEAYIRKGYITPTELDHYKQRLDLYHKLGGNGHMEYWDAQINKLPHADMVNDKKYE